MSSKQENLCVIGDNASFRSFYRKLGTVPCILIFPVLEIGIYLAIDVRSVGNVVLVHYQTGLKVQLPHPLPVDACNCSIVFSSLYSEILEAFS